MNILSTLVGWMGIAAAYLWNLFTLWLSIFAAPAKNFEILWIIIPVWLNWIFIEWFLEKEGTGFGHAVSNGVVALWVGIDWLRFLTGFSSKGNSIIHFIPKILIALLVLVYGIVVIIGGIRRSYFVHSLGRIREVTYALLMFTPIIYGTIPITMRSVLAIVVFFPLFYGFIEIIDRNLPSPATYMER